MLHLLFDAFILEKEIEPINPPEKEITVAAPKLLFRNETPLISKIVFS